MTRIPLYVTALLFFIVLALQIYFLASDSPTAYLIVGGILLFMAALAVVIQILLLRKSRRQ
jgi:hypothetical protein